MSLVREALEGQGISPSAQEVILNSWRSSTQKQYNIYLEKWPRFTTKRTTDPLQLSLKLILDFFQELYENGLGYSGMNTARSALSSIIMLEGHPVGTHPSVQRYLKGVFQSRPSLPRYNTTWDTTTMLNFLSTLSPTQEINLQLLTYKLVMLCALVTGQRCQSLHLMSLDSITKKGNSYLFIIDKLVKQSAPGKYQPVLEIPEFAPDINLCAATVMDEYIKRTQPLRNDETQLFISFIKPFKKVSKDTISRWIKKVMNLAGIDTTVFKPHSTRAASTSKAKTCQLTLSTIMKSASWSSDCVFNRYYNKPIQGDSESFGHTILSGAAPD